MPTAAQPTSPPTSAGPTPAHMPSLPGASYPECILFAIDLSLEVSLEASKGITRLEVLKQSCALMATAKKRVDSRHMFGLIVLRETAELVMPPTRNLDALGNAVQHVNAAAISFESFELGSLLEASRKAAAALVLDAENVAPQVRVVLLYCRSVTIPIWTTHTTMPLAVDALYMHEKPMPGINCPQEVFTSLEEQCDTLSRNANHQAYIFECSASNLKKFFNILVWMLVHPAQRVPQARLQTTPTDIAPVNAITTGTSPE